MIALLLLLFAESITVTGDAILLRLFAEIVNGKKYGYEEPKKGCVIGDIYAQLSETEKDKGALWRCVDGKKWEKY